MRKLVLAGNWKMNKLASETKDFFGRLIPLVSDTENTVVICAPYTDLAAAVSATKGTNIAIGAQNVHWEEKGAFTGEISVEMLKEIGVRYVILGHSERRQYFGDTNQTVAKRAKAVLSKGLKAIVCVGETLVQRENGITEETLSTQVRESIDGITAKEMQNAIIAYEPIWAIGTGVTATKEQAEDTIRFIRGVVENLYGKTTAENTIIQYGGSMNESNAFELLSMPDIDGGLIGGASLTAEKFAAVVNAKKTK